MSSIPPLTFVGVSTFSEQFQQILDRAVAIAQVPVDELANKQADLITKKQLLTSLRGGVEGLAGALKNLGTLGANKALTVTSSNSNRVTATNNGATSAAVYTITEITSVAKAASERTATGRATADATQVDADGVVELVFGNQTHVITLDAADNNLNGLRDAINELGLGLSATVLNTGSGADPYYLSLTSATTGATTLQIRTTQGDSGTNILTATNQGANAVFKLNGLSINNSSNTITDAIPGVSFTIVSATTEGESVTLSLSSSSGELANKLSSLVSAYNAVRTQVNAQVGETAGLLSGDYIIGLTRTKMREIVNYEGGDGNITSLAALGIELSSDGVMSFNSDKFYSLNSAQIADAFSMLGTETTGLGALAAGFTNISDPDFGLIKTQQDQYDAADKRFQTQIDEMVTRIEVMQLGMNKYLQQADALLASLESQQVLLDASIQSVNYALYGKQDK